MILQEKLKYKNVIHEARDFYKDINNNTIPDHDVLITNPPYSENHKQKVLEFAFQNLKKQGIRFLLLLPNYVVGKAYFKNLVNQYCNQTDDGSEGDVKEEFPIRYVVPNQAYEYDHPENTGHEVPPFFSIWICGGFTYSIDNDNNKISNIKNNSVRIVNSISELCSIGALKMDKRLNPKQRRKRKQRSSQFRKTADITVTTVNHDVKRSHNNSVKRKEPSSTSRYRDKTGKRTKKRF